MSIIIKPNTFTVGAVIVASEHNSNFDTLYSDYNGNIDNNNIKASAGIVDTKLAQITTASKVDASTALTGTIPAANLANSMLLTTAQTAAGIKTFSSIPVLPASDPTTDNQAVRKAYVDVSVEDYGSSASSSTTRTMGALIFAFGSAALTAGSLTITNLNFTSNTSYTIVGTLDTDSGTQSQAITVIRTSGAQAVFADSQSTGKIVHWMAWGT